MARQLVAAKLNDMPPTDTDRNGHSDTHKIASTTTRKSHRQHDQPDEGKRKIGMIVWLVALYVLVRVYTSGAFSMLFHGLSARRQGEIHELTATTMPMLQDESVMTTTAALDEFDASF